MSRHKSVNWSRRRLLASGALAGLFSMSNPLQAAAKQATPWRNWSGGVSCNPQGRFSPATQGQLQEFLATTSGAIRPVGSGHSFTPLVPTDGHLIVIDQLTGLVAHDPQKLQATIGAGTRLGDIGAQLSAVGQSMLNLPDIDRQTLAGALLIAGHFVAGQDIPPTTVRTLEDEALHAAFDSAFRFNLPCLDTSDLDSTFQKALHLVFLNAFDLNSQPSRKPSMLPLTQPSASP